VFIKKLYSPKRCRFANCIVSYPLNGRQCDYWQIQNIRWTLKLLVNSASSYICKVKGCNRTRGPIGCETSRLPHFPDNRLADGGEIVSLKRWPPFTPRKIPRTHFCQSLNRPQAYNTAGSIMPTEKSFNILIGIRTHDLPAWSIVPQSITLSRPQLLHVYVKKWTAPRATPNHWGMFCTRPQFSCPFLLSGNVLRQEQFEK
jgi:hypothetical protein